MNIAEVERLTGITKQNIRYYEKEGLISPKRNRENSYREYTKEDIRQLKFIRVLRKIGMPLEEIKQVLEDKISFSEAVQVQRQRAEEKREEMNSVISLCDKLEHQSKEDLDVDYYLNWIQEEEKKGHVLYRLWEDYRDVTLAEDMKKFVFMPDDMITTPREFTEQLFAYAKEQNADITITKESMYPEFVYNGVEYRAYRVHRRHGAIVHCEMIYPELAEPQHIESKRKNVLKMIRLLLPGICIFTYFAVIMFSTYEEGHSVTLGLICVVVLFIIIAITWIPYIKRKK